jgi:hypothetical protein
VNNPPSYRWFVFALPPAVPALKTGGGTRAIRFSLLFRVAVLVFDGGTGSVTLQYMPWDIRSEAAKERIIASGIVLVLVFVAGLCALAFVVALAWV